MVARAPNAFGHAAQARISPVQLKTSASIRLKRLVRDSVYKEDIAQLVLPLPRDADPAVALVELLRDLVPEEEPSVASVAP